jgi:protein TonB
VSVILPPTPPPSARGKTVVLRLTVDARGQVRGVDVTTSTGDRGFDNRLKRTASDWRFNPARQPDGKPVAAQVDISFSF